MAKRKLADPKDFIGIPFHGKFALKISKIYDGSCVSLICEAKEVLIEDVFLHLLSLMNIQMQKNIQMLINFSFWKN